MRQLSALLWCAGQVAILSACAPSALQRKMNTLDGVVRAAAHAGAAECAPEELALARVQLEFARMELKQGEPSVAHRHLILAEPNARAALRVASGASCRRTGGVAHNTSSRPLVAVGDRRGTERGAP